MQKGVWSRLAGGSRRGALIETGPQNRHEDASRSLQERDSKVIKENIDEYTGTCTCTVCKSFLFKAG